MYEFILYFMFHMCESLRYGCDLYVWMEHMFAVRFTKHHIIFICLISHYGPVAHTHKLYYIIVVEELITELLFIFRCANHHTRVVYKLRVYLICSWHWNSNEWTNVQPPRENGAHRCPIKIWINYPKRFANERYCALCISRRAATTGGNQFLD